jgi:CRP/FNR family transcriptional regulator, cyclic AMP receptor protein
MIWFFGAPLARTPPPGRRPHWPAHLSRHRPVPSIRLPPRTPLATPLSPRVEAAAPGPLQDAADGQDAAPLSPELLLKLPVFAGLGFDQAGLLARRGRRIQLQRGALMLEQGQPGHALHLLLSGSAQVFRSADGIREVILGHLAAGDFVGEMSLIDGLPHSASVRCEQICDLLVIDGDAIARCLPLRPILAYALMVKLSQQLRRAQRQVASLALFDVHDRVMRSLFDLAEHDTQGRPWVRQAPPRQGMAKVVGASRDMVSRVMRELEATGQLAPHPQGGLLLLGDCPA